jgi:hypothetical protein
MCSSSLRSPSVRCPPRAVVRFALAALATLPFAGRAARVEAQSAHPSAERAAVDSIVASVFNAMRKGDSAAVRRAFHPRALLTMAGATRDGTPQTSLDSIDAFVKAVGAPRSEIWDERLYEPVIQVDGNLAVVWAPYSFYLGPLLQHCGTNAIQLAKGADGWRIISLVDTRRKTGCRTDPAGDDTMRGA